MTPMPTIADLIGLYALLLIAGFAFFRAGQIWERRGAALRSASDRTNRAARRRRHRAKPTVIIQHRNPVTGQFTAKPKRDV